MEICTECEWREPVWGMKRCPNCLYYNRKRIRKHRENHTEELNLRTKFWRMRNPKIVKENTISWREKNRERIRELNRLYKRNRRSKLGSHTQQEWSNLVMRFDSLCGGCAKPSKLTIDHIIPVSMGGTNNIDNIQPLCRSCNSRKGAR